MEFEFEKITKDLLIFFQYEIAYVSKFLSLNSVLLCEKESAIGIAGNGI